MIDLALLLDKLKTLKSLVLPSNQHNSYEQWVIKKF